MTPSVTGSEIGAKEARCSHSAGVEFLTLDPRVKPEGDSDGSGIKKLIRSENGANIIVIDVSIENAGTSIGHIYRIIVTKVAFSRCPVKIFS